jgi:hypothetical protein
MEGNMYQKILISAMAIIALLSFSCKKDGASSSASSSTGTSIDNDTSMGTSLNYGNIGYALRVSTSFYTLETDTGEESDKTKWTAGIPLGERVSVGKNRRLTFAGDGKVYDFTEVRRDDGKEGFSFAAQVAADGNLAVVIDEKANLYSSAKDSGVTGEIISRKTVIVLFPKTESDGFVEFKAYDPVAERNRQSFIKLSSLSRKDSDIQSSILLQLAQPLKNEGTEKNRKEALLATAMERYPDSAFSAEIQALANPNAAAVIETQSVSNGFMTVTDNNVNVRNIPDQFGGRILGQVAKNIVVTVSEQTVNTSTVDGKENHWYHITEPMEGWIFGSFLE